MNISAKDKLSLKKIKDQIKESEKQSEKENLGLDADQSSKSIKPNETSFDGFIEDEKNSSLDIK